MNVSGNRRILLIDDMPSIHEDFRKILEAPAAGELNVAEAALFGEAAPAAAPGFELDSAHQGREGAALVEAAIEAGRPYAVAFVDMRMPPGWDGAETIAQLWRIDPRVQVVICTAYSDHPWEEVLPRLDVQDRLLVLKKPFDSIEVRQLAATLTAKWDLTREAASHMKSLEQAVRDLTATEADLRRSNEDLEGFARSVSHDLRSPLIAMGAFSNLLARELNDHPSKNVQHYLSRIQACAVVGERLIEGLLALARIARAQLLIEPIDLSAMTRQLVEEIRGADRAREVCVTVQERLRCHGDRRLMVLAMRHLLDNAWKFTSGRPEATIEIGGYAGAAGDAVFFVRDNGAGFDMAYAGKLFRGFQRLHPSNEFPGTGIGLVTVSRIIERHGGRIWADSKPSEGTSLYFTLPAVRSTEIIR